MSQELQMYDMTIRQSHDQNGTKRTTEARFRILEPMQIPIHMKIKASFGPGAQIGEREMRRAAEMFIKYKKQCVKSFGISPAYSELRKFLSMDGVYEVIMDRDLACEISPQTRLADHIHMVPPPRGISI